MSSSFNKRIHDFIAARRGNVAMIFALSAPVLCFGIAIAVDFTNATVVRSKLNAAADAASLAALTPAMMQQPISVAQAAAQSMFNARAAALGSLVAGQTTVTATVTPDAKNGALRRVTVEYWAQTNVIFNGILPASTMGVHGISMAQASVPPNIDFYLLLDNSPSMALPATADGITQMQSITSKQESGVGCAFACHQASTNNSDTAGNLCTTGGTLPTYSTPTTSSNTYCAAKNAKGQTLTQMDNYAMARYNNISLRLDELSTGITSLMQTATQYQTSGIYLVPPIYRFAAYTMDSLWQIQGNSTGNGANTLLMALNTAYTASWAVASTNFGVMQMYANNANCSTAACTAGGSLGDVATNYDAAMSSINTTLPTPGYGTNATGDKPQEVLFIVTDGVEDAQIGGRVIQAMMASGTNYCSSIKARGVKIAILYTEYLPVPSNSFYVSNVQPFQNNIGTALQACATSGLYYDAVIGTNLGTALSTLFQAVVQSAALSN